jgi:hypothetical protein
MKGTNSEPHELGPKHADDVHGAFTHLEGTFSCYCREHRNQRYLGGGSKRLARWSSRVDMTEGQKLQVTHTAN